MPVEDDEERARLARHFVLRVQDREDEFKATARRREMEESLRLPYAASKRPRGAGDAGLGSEDSAALRETGLGSPPQILGQSQPPAAEGSELDELYTKEYAESEFEEFERRQRTHAQAIGRSEESSD